MGAQDSTHADGSDLEDWASTLRPQSPTWSQIPVWTECPEATEPLAKLFLSH